MKARPDTAMAESSGSRAPLLLAARDFVLGAANLPGIARIALIGSLTTEKKRPKDVDLLLTIGPAVDWAPLAGLSRKLRGRAQSGNQGADVFLADEGGTYVGRVCSYREPWRRVACGARVCGVHPYQCDDRALLTLGIATVKEPPLELWPRVRSRGELPRDVEELLVTGLPWASETA
jgi:hypothetical protein